MEEAVKPGHTKEAAGRCNNLKWKLKVLRSGAILFTVPLSAQCINGHRQQCKTCDRLASQKVEEGLEMLFLYD